MPTFLQNLDRNVHFQSLLAWCLLLGLMSYAPHVSAQPDTFEGNPDSSAFIKIPRNTDDWTRHFRIGALVGININANFSMSGNFPISGNNAANGIFNDGYVLHDPGGDYGGNTHYWGYDSASQLNGTTLTMHANTSFNASGSAKESGVFPGFDMAYGDNLWYWKHARVGWELGFGLLPITISDKHPLSATSVNQSLYNYDVSNPDGIPIPDAPYQGGSSGTGHPIPDTPSSIGSRQIPAGSETVTGTRKLDVMLYTLRLGPSFYWDLTEHVSMSLGAGPAVGLVSGDYKYDETISADGVSTPNSGKFGTTGIVYGGYVNATLMYHVVDNGDVYAGVQFMPMSDASFSSAGREARLNLGGQVYFTIGINWPF